MTIIAENLKPSNYSRKNFDSNGRRTSAGDRTYDESRVFLNFVGETILDNLNNRRQRPSTSLKPLVKKALEEAGIEFTKIRWSSKAGCRMCPCSPGFIIEGNYGTDFWIDVTDNDTDYKEVVTIVI